MSATACVGEPRVLAESMGRRSTAVNGMRTPALTPALTPARTTGRLVAMGLLTFSISARLLTCAMALLPAIGCISRTSGGTPDDRAATASAPSEPPRMLRGNPPQLSVPSGSAAGRDALRVTIEVLVDAAGQPDMKTLRVTGRGGAENREAIARWIQGSAFRPARRAGQPVAGVYKTTVAARVVTRRM